ncbi:MAG: ankyrin repeat domain-containing protein, partial [Armatimonadetes bacterium]|nr:ankyrin repeat domain-containing protein [Armatimonadota bacterium]
MRKKVELTPADIDLHQAAMDGDVGAAQTAFASGANVDSPEEEHYITPLLWACAFGHFEVASFLVGAGADVNYADENGDTPLHNAVSIGQIEIVRLLLQHGADANHLNASGHTVIEAVAAYETADVEKRKMVIVALLEAGCNVNARNLQMNHQTPLMVATETAAEIGNLEIVRYLISKGADVNAVDDEQ